MDTVAVVGVFWREVEHLRDWLESVSLHSTLEGNVTPVIVKCFDATSDASFDAEIAGFGRRGLINDGNVLRLANNAGPSVAFNCAVAHIRQHLPGCEWIASLDPDARFAPSAIDALLNVGRLDGSIGMVAPVVVRPRATGDYVSRIDADELVSHCGHRPLKAQADVLGTKHNWVNHYADRKVADVVQAIELDASWEPFSVCFCASLLRRQMLDHIGGPDERQFRTLNCGEISYRARLHGWTAAVSTAARAFHPPDDARRYHASAAQADSQSVAWHYHHARALIGLRYYPETERPLSNASAILWRTLFPDLQNVDSYYPASAQQKLELFSQWEWFCER